MLNNQLCLFACYIKDKNELDVYQLKYLKELCKYFDTWLIANQYPNNIRNLNIKTAIVDNYGFDFGKFKYLINLCKDYERLILVNDSCCLLKPIGKMIQKLNNCQADVIGITSSWEIEYHLQSYFLAFAKKTFNFLLDYFSKTPLTNNRHEIIKNYEIGLSKRLLENNYILQAIYEFPYNPFNTTFSFVNELISKDCPLIKRKFIFEGNKDDDYEQYFKRNNISILSRNKYKELVNNFHQYG